MKDTELIPLATSNYEIGQNIMKPRHWTVSTNLRSLKESKKYSSSTNDESLSENTVIKFFHHL
jgi:hypothetical protein